MLVMFFKLYVLIYQKQVKKRGMTVLISFCLSLKLQLCRIHVIYVGQRSSTASHKVEDDNGSVQTSP